MFELLDLIGVFAFAVFGAHKAITARFDLFGIISCGAITAFGGGTIRELILNGTPVYLYDYRYPMVALVGAVCAVVLHRRFAIFEKYVLVLDAVGVAIFAYIGAYRAEAAHLGLVAMIFFAVLTAVGGGVISDVVSGRRPEAFYKDFYPLAAILLAIGYFVIRPEEGSMAALTLIVCAFAIRLISIRHGWRLWRPYQKSAQKTLLRLRKFIPLFANYLTR